MTVFVELRALKDLLALRLSDGAPRNDPIEHGGGLTPAQLSQPKTK
jgi:hypothetical protein